MEKSSDRAYIDIIVKAQQTNDGGYIAFGVTDSYGAGTYDAWMIKTDSNGNEDWNKTFGTTGQDCALGGQQTSDGGYILVGIYSMVYVWLIKTNSYGVEEWNKKYGDTDTDCGYFVQQTSDGGYIITGYTESYDVGVRDVWLIKTDSNGNEEWNNTFGGGFSDGGFVVREIDDGYIITGWTGSYGAGDHDVWLIKTDSYGNEDWNKTYGGIYEDEGHDVQQTSEGGYIIIGSTSSYGDLNFDFWLIKTDENGVEEWNNTFGGYSGSTVINLFNFFGGLSVRQITDGYIMTGVGEGGPGGGLTDVLLIETDDEGNETWNKTYGGNGRDDGYWLNETSDGGYIIGGATWSYANGYYDGWLIKTDSNGNEDWNKTFGTSVQDNNPPDDPSTPDGPDEGTIGVEYMFNTSAEDPEGDDVYYKFDWGDGSYSEWLGPYPSGDIGSASHSWDGEGDYDIKAMAMDENGGMSDWSPTLTIHITEKNEPPGKPTIAGRNEGKIGKEYDYTFKAADADGDDVRYNISWGDGSPSQWTGYFAQDISVKVKHTFEEEGTYKIKAYAQDEHGADGPETEYEVTMPKNKPFVFNFPLLIWLFEHFPNAFPILRYLVGK